MEVRDRKVEVLACGCLRLQDARGRASYLPPPPQKKKKGRKKARKKEEKKGKKTRQKGNIGWGGAAHNS